MKKCVLMLCGFLLLFLPHAGLAEEVSARAAILATGGKDAESIVAIVEAGLSATDDIEIIDRAQIVKVLAEHDMSIKGMLSQDDVFKAGKLLGCDLFVDVNYQRIRVENDGTLESLVVRSFDAVTGSRLSDVPLDTALNIDERVEIVRASILASVKKMKEGRAGEGKSISVNTVRVISLPIALKHVPVMLPTLLARYLLLSPGISVLERDRLALVDNEAKISRDTREHLLASAVIIDLDMSKAGNDGDIKIRASLNDIAGEEIGAASVEGAGAALAGMVIELSEKISKMLSVLSIEVSPDMLAREADHHYAMYYWYRARDVDSPESLDVSLTLAEGALAKDKSDEQNQYRISRVLGKQMQNDSNHNSGLRRDELLVPFELFLSRLERCVDLLELGLTDEISFGEGHRRSRSGGIYTAHHTIRSQKATNPQERERLYSAQKRILAWHRKTREHNGNIINGAVLLAGSRDADAFVEELFFLNESCSFEESASPLSRLLNVKGICNPDMFFTLPFYFEEAHDSRSSGYGITDENKQKMMRVFEAWAVDKNLRPAVRMEYLFCAIVWANIHQDIFADHEEIAEKYLDAAKKLAVSNVRLVCNFAALVGCNSGVGGVTLSNLKMPKDKLVPVLRELLLVCDKKKIATPDILVLLDVLDAEGADYPGAYLHKAVSQLEDGDYGLKKAVSRWSNGKYYAYLPRKECVKAVKSKAVQRYGNIMVKAFSAEEEKTLERKLLFGLSASSIVEAGISGSKVYIVVANRSPSGLGIVCHDLETGKQRSLGVVKSAGMSRNGGMYIGQQNIYLYTSAGLAMLPLDGGDGRLLDEKAGLPMKSVSACYEVGNHLYLAGSGEIQGNAGNSFLVKCAMDGSDVEILAASGRKETKSALDNTARSYSISKITNDPKNNRIIFAISDHSYLHSGGLWSCDVSTGEIEKIKPEFANYPVLMGKNQNDEYVVRFSAGRGVKRYVAWKPGRDERILMVLSVNGSGRLVSQEATDFPIGFPLYGDKFIQAGAGDSWMMTQLGSKKVMNETVLPKLDEFAPFFVEIYKGRLIACTYKGLYSVDPALLEAMAHERASSDSASENGQASEVAESTEVTIISHVGGILDVDGQKYKMRPGCPLHWRTMKAGAHNITVDWCGKKWGGAFDLQAGGKVDLKAFPSAKAEKVFVLDMGQGVAMRFVWIPAGEFTMGGPEKYEYKPIQKVAIGSGFWMGQYELTLDQQRRVLEPDRGIYSGAQYPAGGYSWESAREFCKKLQAAYSEQLNGKIVRLPNEAEWEYACRAGTTTRFYFGDSEKYYDLAAAPARSRLGERMPNLFWLYGMHGGYYEWCDIYSPIPQKSGQVRIGRRSSAARPNGMSPTHCGIRVVLEEEIEVLF